MEAIWDYKSRGYLKKTVIQADEYSLRVVDKFTLCVSKTRGVLSESDHLKLLNTLSGYQYIKHITLNNFSSGEDEFLIGLFQKLETFSQLEQVEFTFDIEKAFSGGLGDNAMRAMGRLVSENKNITVLKANNVCGKNAGMRGRS